MRLIDADALRFEIVNKPSEFKAFEATPDFLTGMAHRSHEVLDILEAAPTVDAVPVVRCKDCKWQEPHYCEGIVRCGRFKSGKKQLWMRDNDFCSCGERKKDDNVNV